MASRYDPFGVFLAGRADDLVPVTFGEVEAALGFALPPSKRYPAWWSNNPSNNPMTKVWLEAGFVSEQVDTVGEKLVFRRVKAPEPRGVGVEEAGRLYVAAPGLIARLRAALGGTVKYAPGFDPTEPTGEVWDAQQ
jgi:hypothetical protein